MGFICICSMFVLCLFFYPTTSLLSYSYLYIHQCRYWMPTGVLRNSVTLPCRSSWLPTTTPCRSTPTSRPASRTRTTLSTRSALNTCYVYGRLSKWRVLGIMLRWEVSELSCSPILLVIPTVKQTSTMLDKNDEFFIGNAFFNPKMLRIPKTHIHR